MTVKQYAEFTNGQTLTSGELNTLMVHAIDRDRMVGRMTGFGTNCGLKGSFAGNILTITAGLAVDQRGEALVATAAHTIAFPPTVSGTAFGFISTAPGGFSVVLRGDYVPTPPVSCADLSTCAGHAATEMLTLTYEVVPGRITGGRFDFASEPLLTAEPMRLTIASQPTNDFNALRATLVARLTNSPGSPLVDTALIAKLAAVTMPASDLPGVKGYKAAWLNMVLFATLDLLRCRALMNVDCLRTTTNPGVVLGWAEQVGSTWNFRCTYRHEWEPPTGLSQALLGGTCGDPCGVFKDTLEGILAGYAPPDPPPAPSTPPSTGGGGIVIPGTFVDFCSYGYVFQGGRCVMLKIPYYVDTRPFPPPGYATVRPDYRTFIEDYSLVEHVDDYYGQDKWNVYGDGVLDARNLLGEYAENVEATLDKVIKEHGGTANFQQVKESELGSVDGYLPSTAFSPSDGVVLTVNSKGIVVGLGRVPAVHSARQIGTAIPQALAAGAKVDAAMDTMTSIATGVDESIGAFEQKLGLFDGGLKGLQEQFQSFKGGEFDESGFGVRLAALENKTTKVDLYGERIATLEGRAFPVKGAAGVGAGGFDVNVAKGLAEFTQTTIEAMKSITDAPNKNLTRYIAAAERSQGDFEIAAAGGNEVDVRTATVELLDTVRTMVKAGGADAGAARKLDAQFREIQGMLG